MIYFNKQLWDSKEWKKMKISACVHYLKHDQNNDSCQGNMSVYDTFLLCIY